MTLLSRKTDYALLILLHLHQNPEGGCAREIADRFHLSRAFVANILKELCNKGFVTSHRGVKGGYILQRAPEETHFSDLISSLDETFRLAECNHTVPDDGCQLVHSCPLKGPMAEIHARILKLLSTISLADIFGRVATGSELLKLSLPAAIEITDLAPVFASSAEVLAE